MRAFPMPTISVEPRAVFGVILAPIVILIGLSIAQDLVHYSAGGEPGGGKVWLLDVDVERSVYTWYSTLLLFVTAQILFVVGACRRQLGLPMAWHWLGLSLVFALLSADEALSLHEKLSEILSARLETGGVFFFAWTAPALLLSLGGLVAYIPFLSSVPAPERRMMLAAAALFLSGAIGLEMVAGAHADGHGVATLPYRMLANAEECLEGLGVALFIFAILRVAGGLKVTVPDADRLARGAARPG